MDGIPSLLSSAPGMLSYMNGVDKQRSPWKEKPAFAFRSHFCFPLYCNVLHNHASVLVSQSSQNDWVSRYCNKGLSARGMPC